MAAIKHARGIMAERLYSTRQVADLLGATPATIDTWIAHGWLPSEHLPEGSVRVSEAGLVRFLRDRGINLEEIMARVSVSETPQPAPHAGETATEPEHGAPQADSSPEARPDETGRGTPASGQTAEAVLHAILQDAARRGASDVYLEPQADGLALRMRIGGRLFEKANFKARLPESLRQELMACARSVARLGAGDPERGQQAARPLQLDGQTLDLLVSTSPGAHGETVAIHLSRPQAARDPLAELGLSPEQLARVRQLLAELVRTLRR
jgi:type II secretory ATPase GspE/PulE/Tfp pilus assembly ATPase PilB-like protein